jgi:putative addiction module CopG family antidote
MTVEIPLECQQFVTNAIACGEFKTEGEVIVAALRILEERRQTTEYLRREMQVGLDELDCGEYVEFDEVSLKEFFEQVKAEGRKDLQDRPKTS